MLLAACLALLFVSGVCSLGGGGGGAEAVGGNVHIAIETVGVILRFQLQNVLRPSVFSLRPLRAGEPRRHQGT